MEDIVAAAEEDKEEAIPREDAKGVGRFRRRPTVVGRRSRLRWFIVIFLVWYNT